MSPLFERIKALVPHFPSQQELDQAYLNESVDVYDVERRMWEIDHRSSPTTQQSGGLGGLVH